MLPKSDKSNTVFPDEEKKDKLNMVQKFGMSFLFRSYAEVSTISGIAQLERSQEVLRKIMWTLVVLGGAGALSWQMYLTVMKYLSYGVNTIISQRTNTSLPFPAITVCNINPVDYLKIASVSPEIYNMLKALEPTSTTSNNNNNGGGGGGLGGLVGGLVEGIVNVVTNVVGGLLNGLGMLVAGLTSNVDVNYQYQLQVQAKLANLTLAQRVSVGSDLNFMLLTCFYNNIKCNSSDFLSFYNYQYGNCFIFNMMNNKTPSQTFAIGPQYGLRMMIFINSSTYIPLTEKSGLRIVVHHQTEYPYPEDSGIFAPPGKHTSVALKLSVNNICPPPYGECLSMTPDYAMGLSAYVNLLPNVTYYKEGCIKTCLQKHILLNCGCFHPYFPYNISMAAYKNIPKSKIFMCNITEQSNDTQCYKNVKYGIMNMTLDCTNCTLPCSKYSYSTTSSYCNWPSDAYKQTLINFLKTISPMKEYLATGVNASSVIENQILSLDIYYDSLTYIDVTDQPAYELLSLISDLGGQMGLWLGLSMAALFEIIELLFDTVMTSTKLMFMKCCKKPPKENIQLPIKKVAWEKI